MTIFQKIKVEGFASYVNYTEFDFDKEGLTVLAAKNGKGKTKLLSALLWCCWGKTLGDHTVEPWEWVITKDYRGTKVEQGVIVNGSPLKIIRCKNYLGKVEGAVGKDRLILIENGKVYPGGKIPTQKRIIELLGFSVDLFKSSVLFGQKLKRFISEKGPKKKELFDEAAEVAYIPEIKKQRLKVRQSILSDYSKVTMEISGIESTLESLEEQLEEYEEAIADFNKSKRKKVKNLKRELEEAISSTAELKYTNPKPLEKKVKAKKNYLKTLEANPQLRAKGELTKTLGKLEVTGENLVSQMSSKNREHSKLINTMETLGKVACSRCGHKLTKSEAKEEKSKISKECQVLEKELKDLSTKLANNSDNLVEHESLISSISTIETNINTQRVTLDKLEKALAKVLEDNTTVKNRDSIVADLELQLERVNNEKLGIDTQKVERKIKRTRKKLRAKKKIEKATKKELELEDWAINGPLSNAGIKAFVFQNIITDINKACKKYTSVAGFRVKFFIDGDSANKDIVTHVYHPSSKVVPYDDLSGGQSQMVDVITAFSFQDVVGSKRSCNILVLDEIFESLDPENVEKITQLIEDKAKDKSVILVTHKQDFNPINSRIVDISYKAGVSSIN